MSTHLLVAFGDSAHSVASLKAMANSDPSALNALDLHMRFPSHMTRAQFFAAYVGGKFGACAVYGDDDVPTETSDNGWPHVVRQGECLDVRLTSGFDPSAPASTFRVTPTADLRGQAALLALARAILVGTGDGDGALSVLDAGYANVRPNDANHGRMHGLGLHEWVGGVGDRGRRMAPYAFKKQDTPRGATFATMLQRTWLPALRAGTRSLQARGAPVFAGDALTPSRPRSHPRSLTPSALRPALAPTRAPSHPPALRRRAAWLATFAIVFCFWQCSESLSNAFHYDREDKGPSQAVWFWSHGRAGVRCGAWFLLPAHGIAVELGATSIAWRGDLVLHATHMTALGKSSTATLLSVWNGVGGSLLRALLDRLCFKKTDSHSMATWRRIPRGVPVIVQWRTDGDEQDDGTWTKGAYWRHAYGTVWSTPARGGTPQRTLGAAGFNIVTPAHVKVWLDCDRSKQKTKKTAVKVCDVRVHWQKMRGDDAALAALRHATQDVKKKFDVDALMAASAEKARAFVTDARSGATTARGTTRRTSTTESAERGAAESGGAESGGAKSRGAEPRRTKRGGAKRGGAKRRRRTAHRAP